MSRVVNGTKMQRWTKAETVQLQNMMNAGQTYNEIAQALCRTRAAVATKIQNCRGVLNIAGRTRTKGVHNADYQS
jgi:DNA-binding NarL/FixJ family response regulator